MTQAQAINWLVGQVGQHLDYDHAYGQQCVDFFNYYYQALTGRSPYTDGFGVSGAKDLWNITTSRFDKIPNSNTLVPQAGDVLIYGSSWGAGYGHVEVCLSSDSSGSWVVGENEHGNTTEGVVKVYRTWAQMAGLIGVMRPKYEGVNMAGIPDADNYYWRFSKLMQQIRGRAPSRDEFRKNFVGVEPFHMVEILSDDPEADRATDWQNLGEKASSENWQQELTDLQKKVDDLTAANLKLTDQLQAVKSQPVSEDAAAQVVADKAGPITSFIKLIISKLKIGG